MPEGKADTIKISVLRRHEIAADRADLHVTVEGASLFTGGEALKKAREVAQLVRELTEGGLPMTDIHLQGVYADTAAGLLGKTSLARYKLRLHCTDLARLADLLGIVTGQKNARLTVIEWGYPDDEGIRDQWLGECIARANAKAARVAQGLNVRLLGVHAFSEKYLDGEKPNRTTVAEEGMVMMRARSKPLMSEELGLEISHTKTVHVSVEAEYLVSAYESAPSP